LKTIIVLAAHGAPPTDYPARNIGMLMAMESLEGIVKRFGFLRARQHAIDAEVRNWKRTRENDPYKNGVDALVEQIAAQTHYEVIAGYNEFCNPTIGQAIDQAITNRADKVIVATTMLTRGGAHSEIEIRELVHAAQKRHPSVTIVYAWPFEVERVAKLFAEEIARF